MLSNKLLGKIGLFNLLIVAAIGVIMRYKIGFEFPYFDQKNLQHGHSHFAFSGWVSHILYLLLYTQLPRSEERRNGLKKLQYLIIANLFLAYAMLISFILQGYGAISIAISTLSVACSYFFAWFYFMETKQNAHINPSSKWNYWGLFLNIVSSFGTFYLAYMMATKSISQHFYLGSIYFFLHFQYSGWFFFACMGFFIAKLNAIIPGGVNNDENLRLFKLFAIASIPAFLLSILWANLPWYMYAFAIIAAILQLVGLWKLTLLIKTNIKSIKEKWSFIVRLLYSLAFLALVIKLFLQSGSLFPEISKLAFGFRSIVIAYLHLVLLVLISLFLIGALFHEGYIRISKWTIRSIITFCIGVFLNEFILMLQGITSFSYILIPYLNEALFGVSIILFLSLTSLIVFNKKTALN